MKFIYLTVVGKIVILNLNYVNAIFLEKITEKMYSIVISLENENIKGVISINDYDSLHELWNDGQHMVHIKIVNPEDIK